jgi:hypothetical protein
MARNFADEIEALVDRTSVRDVLIALANVCGAKAAHIEENWQDTRLSKAWEKAAKKIDSTAAAVAVVLPEFDGTARR